MSYVLQIIVHTPLWVWPLLVLVVALGVRGLRPAVVPAGRLWIWPLVGLGVTLAGIVQSPLPAVAVAGWLLGLLPGVLAGRRIAAGQGAEWQANGRLALSGSWFGLVFGLGIFAVRYAFGVLFGMAPGLRADPAWIVVAGATGGVFAGIGFGWVGGLLRRRPGTASTGSRGSGLRRLAWGLAGLVGGGVLAAAAVLAFDSPAAPPRLAAGDSLPGVDGWNRTEVPAQERVTARDGAPLLYRRYPAAGDRAVVLVHGSSASNFSMHKLAQALQAAGATVYSVSLRGHGGSGTLNGDTSYRGQLDDDLADFVAATGLDRPGLHRSLIGFSSGGGFVLRTASGGNARLFDDYLAISPFVAPDSPTSRPDTGGWTAVAVPRIVVLTALDRLGLPLFQGLEVVRFATDARAGDGRTPAYSYRLVAGLHLPRDWRVALAGIARPTAIVVGAGDELFEAGQFQPLLAALNPRVTVEVEPGLGHLAMITDPRAIQAVVGAWQRLGGL